MRLLSLHEEQHAELVEAGTVKRAREQLLRRYETFGALEPQPAVEYTRTNPRGDDAPDMTYVIATVILPERRIVARSRGDEVLGVVFIDGERNTQEFVPVTEVHGAGLQPFPGFNDMDALLVQMGVTKWRALQAGEMPDLNVEFTGIVDPYTGQPYHPLPAGGGE